MSIRIKRVYEDASPEDGYRVLVDRLWPRGVRKDALKMDEWAKDVTPSSALRKDWHSGRISDTDFAANYRAELDGNPKLAKLAHKASHDTLTLLVATRNVATSHAHVLAKEIQDCI